MDLIAETKMGGTLLIEMTHPTGANPFGVELEDQIKAALHRAQVDPQVQAVVVTGGVGRSFSTGGDFNEVKNLSGGEDVDRWIDRVTALYVSALHVDKPTVAAIDGFAIGMGFQFALMFDHRVMAEQAEFRMPELRHGIGCSMGAAILSGLVSRNVAREIVFACENIEPPKALAYGIVNEVTPAAELIPRALAAATRLASYPEVAFRSTKRSLVAPLIRMLHETAGESKEVHRAAFAARAMQAHFQRVLGDHKYAAPVGDKAQERAAP